MAGQLPRIKITDPNSEDQTAPADIPSSPNVSPRPKSSSSEGQRQSGGGGGKSPPTKLLRNPQSKNVTATKSSSQPHERAPAIIDPISQILKRTNTGNASLKLRGPAKIDSASADSVSLNTDGGVGSNRPFRPPEFTRTDTYPLKEKKKGVSFLSRLGIMGGKRKDTDDLDDDESELGDLRTEGMNAHVFSSSINANGYIPQHKEPPQYIKVRQRNKREREFDRMFLAQELHVPSKKSGEEKRDSTSTAETHSRPSTSSGGPVWAVEFSKDGKYLAAAGQDAVVRVWSVISNPEEREVHELDEDVSTGTNERLSAPVFRGKPIREFEGHTSVVLDLSWSKNNFLLSSSMDKTVRLWHVSRQECLCTFKHKDFVTSIAFHPRDDRFFLAGSLDSVLRLWSIPDKSVAFWNQLPDLITAVAFSPDGKTAMAGVLSGFCLFYETEGLKYYTQIHVRSSRGRNAKGSKITGIRTCIYPPNDLNGEIKVLITSNDSRVRLYNLRDKTLEMKFKGHENTCSQIKASFSDDAKYIICGSEDRKTFIWSIDPVQTEMKDKIPVEIFEAHSDIVTATVMAPVQTRQLLSGSGDPIYDLCNPPPVTLLSREESRASSKSPVRAESSDKGDSSSAGEKTVRKPEESPAYLARCQHMDGNIIITADHSGSIKVFRQDCAYRKRYNDNAWETGSTFSRRIGTGMLGRTASIMTRGSGGSHSRRNSISQRPTTSAQLPTDRILSWRSTIPSTSTLDGSSSIRHGISGRSDRSVSPGRLPRPATVAGESHRVTRPGGSMPRQFSFTVTPTTTTSSNTSPAPSVKATSNQVSQPPTPSFSLQSASDDNSLKLDPTGKSYQFWNMQQYKAQMGAVSDPDKLGSELAGTSSLTRTPTWVSKLSDEESATSFGASNSGESESDLVACKRCGGRDFRARKLPGRLTKRLVCTRCGSSVE